MTRILILDDRPINRQFLTTLLSYKGFETREAGDGVEGLEIAHQWMPDLAIVDIQMPGMNGVEFVKRVHADADPLLASMPIIFYTASYEDNQAAQMARECGVEHLLMKPSEPELILETIDKALGRSRLRRSSAVAESAATEFVRLHSDAMRVGALVEFQLEVAVQRKPEEILKLLARAARNIIPSVQAVVTMIDGGHAVEFSSDETAPPSRRSPSKEWMADARPMRTTEPENLLGVPIESANDRYGWLSLIKRYDSCEYSIEDERIALTIAAQAAVAYENLLLYETIRQKAELLDRNVSLLSATIEASGDGILVVDRESRFVTYNNRFVAMWRVPQDILLSGGAHASREHALTQVRDPESLRAAFERAANGEEVFGTFEINDGRFIECHAGPRMFEGEMIGRVWSFRDFTGRKRAEEELRRVARDRELLMESTGDGIYAMDNDGRCTMANRVAGVLLGRTIEDLTGRSMHELIHHHKADGSLNPAAECAICLGFSAGAPSRTVDEIFWRKDGTSFPVDYVASQLIDDGVVRGGVVTFSDVTDRRKLERRLEQVNRVSSLGRMAATIAHEFNNVLMGIQPFAEVIRKRAGEDVKLQQAAIQIINSVTRGKSITQDILRMTRSPSPILQSVDVTEWLGQVVTEIRALVGVSFTVAVQLPPPGSLFGRFDPSQMQQVITNLALNARDAMTGGGTLSFSAVRSDSHVRFGIGDTGCGIPADTLPFIFEPLFTTKQSGTGLGLAVAQQLVIGNGGTITVESNVGSGTWFHIELPSAPPPESRAPAEARAVPQRGSVRRVVIVEDDEAVASGLSSILEAADIEVLVVDRGNDAMSAVLSFKPDAVLIDVSLPDISGTVVYEQIAAKWPRMGVIFSTGHAEESSMPHPSSRHVGFLRKPYGSEALLNKLRDVV